MVRIYYEFSAFDSVSEAFNGGVNGKQFAVVGAIFLLRGC